MLRQYKERKDNKTRGKTIKGKVGQFLKLSTKCNNSAKRELKVLSWQEHQRIGRTISPIVLGKEERQSKDLSCKQPFHQKASVRQSDVLSCRFFELSAGQNKQLSCRLL